MATSSIIDSSTTTQKKGSPRRLFELLEEKQEPFVLGIYLIERGCRRNRLEFVDSHHIGKRITHNNFGFKNFDKSSGDQSPDSSVRKSSLRFSSIAKSLYSKIVLVNGVLRPKFSSKKKKKTRLDDKDGCTEPGRCSAASFSTSKTWSESDTDRDSVSSSANDETVHNKMGPHRVMGQWRVAEENKQFSPDSVLDEIDLLQAIPVYNKVRRNQYEPATAARIRPPKKASEDSILSASLWEMLEQTKNENANKFGSKSFPKYMNSMKAMLQSRQLLFDCVRDAVETRNNSNNKQRMIGREKGLMGSEELGKIMMSTNLKTWGKLSTKDRRTERLLKTDFLSSDESEWREFGELRREIAMEIGNGLFDDITDEIIRDMVEQF